VSRPGPWPHPEDPIAKSAATPPRMVMRTPRADTRRSAMARRAETAPHLRPLERPRPAPAPSEAQPAVPASRPDDVAEGRKRVVIEGVTPEIEGGAYSVKRVVGEHVVVEADVFADGHDLVACT